jgi:hypothetical protein
MLVARDHAKHSISEKSLSLAADTPGSRTIGPHQALQDAN